MNILNFGSLNIDYVYNVEHFVRPGETIKATSREVFCGGKGLNQSVALARAGARVFHAGLLGGDGDMLKEMLNSAGANIDFIKTGSVTGHAIIQVDSEGENCIIINSGANREITPAFISEVLASSEQGDILLMQNEISSIPALMESAYKRGLQIAFNPSPIDNQLLSYPLSTVKWFILNRAEGGLLSGESEPEAIVSTILSRYENSAVVLTLGGGGVLYGDKERRIRQGVFKVKAVDTTGAGDTFTGYFLAGVAAGADIGEALKRASKAAALAVTKKGAATSIPTLKEVLNAELSEKEMSM